VDLSVIIVSFNVKHFLEHCLLSVNKAMNGINGEVIVVDNHSTDGTPNFLSSRFPLVTCIRNENNMGFSRANNQAIEKARGRYLLFLNPDTIVPENCFINCLQFLETHNDCGALGVRMIDGSGNFLPESKRSFPSALASFYKLSGMSNLFPESNLFSSYYYKSLQQNKIGITEVLSGAFIMASSVVINKVGAFDDSFFMYGEDIDLCYRIHQAGYHNYYLGTTSVIHFKGESTSKNTKKYTDNFYGAMSLYVKKHFKGFRAFLMNIAIFLGKIAASTRKLFLSVKKASIDNVASIFILGSVSQFDETKKLFFHSAPYIKPEKCFDIKQAGKFIKEAALQKNKTTSSIIVFNEDPLTFKEMIDTITEFPNGAHYFFRASGAGSIIGSSDKEKKGLVIC